VQLVTPDEMRGRVSAVNNIFIGTSNEFGSLESGLTAALFGPVVSVVGGGIGTILVVLGVANPAQHLQLLGSSHGRVTEEDTLHLSPYDRSDRFRSITHSSDC